MGNIKFQQFPLLLAPMEDVSDSAFRLLCRTNGADMVFTEFISTDALVRKAEKSVSKLQFDVGERPIGIQIFGADLNAMMASTRIVEHAKPDVLDINFGCPVKKVVHKMCGAGILRDIPKMIKLTEAVVKSTSLPVTVKTRLGWDENSKYIVEVAERLQDVGIKAITIHGRTRKQMYKGEADWQLIAETKNNARLHIPVFGNGDINNPHKAADYHNRYGVDGIMIGRAAIGNPWLFNQIKHYFKTGTLLPSPTISEKVRAVKKHLHHSIKEKGEKLGILVMRKHYGNYFKSLPNIKPLRLKLVTTPHFNEIMTTLDEIENRYDFVDV